MLSDNGKGLIFVPRPLKLFSITNLPLQWNSCLEIAMPVECQQHRQDSEYQTHNCKRFPLQNTKWKICNINQSPVYWPPYPRRHCTRQYNKQYIKTNPSTGE